MGSARVQLRCGVAAVAIALVAGVGDAEDPPLPSVDRLLGRDVAVLESEARRAAATGRWEEAAASWIAVVERRAGDAAALYNLACAEARSGRAGAAATAVAAAWAAGFRDLALIRSDPDLEPLRLSGEWPALVDALEDDSRRREERAGSREWVVAPVPLPVRVSTPSSPLKAAPPLLVVLHGAGDDGEVAGLFRAAGVAQPFVVAAPRGPSPRLVDGRLGFDWRADDGSGLVAATPLVLAAVDAALRRHGADPARVYVLGFSQGATAALALAGEAGRFRGLALVGLPAGVESMPVEGWRRLAGSVLVFHSPDDEIAPASASDELVRRLTAAGVASTRLAYRGGHAVTPEVLTEVSRWITSDAGEAARREHEDGASPATDPCRRASDGLPSDEEGALP